MHASFTSLRSPDGWYVVLAGARAPLHVWSFLRPPEHRALKVLCAVLAYLIRKRRRASSLQGHIDNEETYSRYKSSVHGASGVIDPSQIEICKRPDGSDWLLGQGHFGQV